MFPAWFLVFVNLQAFLFMFLIVAGCFSYLLTVVLLGVVFVFVVFVLVPVVAVGTDKGCDLLRLTRETQIV